MSSQASAQPASAALRVDHGAEAVAFCQAAFGGH